MQNHRKRIRTYYPVGCLFLIVVTCFSCQPLIWWRNGGLYCSSWDQQHHLTPCRMILDTSTSATHLNQVVFSPNSQWLAAVTERITLWDVSTGQLIQSLSLPQGETEALSFSPNNTELAIASSQGIAFVTLPTLQQRLLIPLPDDEAHGVSYSPDGQWLASAGRTNSQDWNNGRIHLFSAQTGQLLQTIPGTYHLEAYTPRFLPDNRHLLFWVEQPASPNSRVIGWIWDMHSQQIVARDVPYGLLSADARLLYPYSRKPTLLELNTTNTGYELQAVLPRSCPLGWDTALIDDPARLISVSNSYDDFGLWPDTATVQVCRVHDGQIIWQSEAQGFCVEMAPNRRIVAVCDFSDVQLWEVPPQWLNNP